ncbi:MAG TPA: ATP-binding protein [Terracidiphilus sp.]|jgi:predicted ATPase|nr:ATP-binding protein [Terracidiphilus sp.]
MLKRLYIDNFRCFVNFEFKPGQKQLLLGPNGSGKSSLLDAILFVKWFIEGGENRFTQSTLTRWQDRPLQVFEIEALIDEKTFEYRLEIRYAPDSKLPSISAETLRVSGSPVFELVDGEVRFYPNDGPEPTGLRWETTESALHLAQFSNRYVRRFVAWMETVHCFQIDPYPGEMEERADSEDRLPEYDLSNLAPWYRHLLQEEPENNSRFLIALKEALASFQSLRFSTDEDGVRKLRMHFATPEKDARPFSISELSEGQRMLIGLYMVLHFAVAKGHTVILDEPDNFVSSREIQPWLLAAEQSVEDNKGQLILISHHPEILNQWASEYGLRFFREENGHVRTEEFKGDADGFLRPSELIARGWKDE